MRRFILAWALTVACLLTVLHLRGFTVLTLIVGGVAAVKASPAGPLLLIAAFVLRPLLLAPCSLLAVASGHCFGALGGLGVALTGCLLAGAIGYTFGRRTHMTGTGLERFQSRLQAHGMRYTMYMRWMMLPYDPVSLVCGASRVRPLSFLVGTILGNLPGTLSCVLFGAGIQGDFTGQLPSFDWRFHGPALLLFLGTLVLSRVVSSRQ